MLVQDICIVSVECNEAEAHSIMDFAVRILNRMFECRVVSRKQFTKHTNREVAAYIAKVNDGYEYIMNRQLFAQQAKSDLSIKDMTTMHQSAYTKPTDLDMDIDPKYFMIEGHYVVPFDAETKQYLTPKMYLRIILNKCLVIREEAVMLELAKQMSRNRRTEYILIKRASANADIREGVEMYYQFNNSQTKMSKAAQAGLFSWYKEYTGIDIAHIMAQIDRNLDIHLAPQIIRDIEAMIKAGDEFVNKMRQLSPSEEVDDDILEDNADVKKEMTQIITHNQQLLASANPVTDGKIFNTYLCFLASHKPPELKQ